MLFLAPSWRGRRIVMDIAAAVLMISIVLYLVQQFNVDPW
jgi:hypothetical protein